MTRVTTHIETPHGVLESLPDSSWKLTFRGEVHILGSVGDALRTFTGLADEHEPTGYRPCYLVPLEEFIDGETADELFVLFEASADGRAWFEGLWVPSRFLIEFDGPDDYAVYRKAEVGAEVLLCAWDDRYLLTVREPLTWERTQRVLEPMSLEEAIEKADAELFEQLCDADLVYPAAIGLDILPEHERFPLPDGSVPERVYVLEVGADETEEVARVVVSRVGNAADARWVATHDGGNQVIGVFGSLDESESVATESISLCGTIRPTMYLEWEDLTDQDE